MVESKYEDKVDVVWIVLAGGKASVHNHRDCETSGVYLGNKRLLISRTLHSQTPGGKKPAESKSGIGMISWGAEF